MSRASAIPHLAVNISARRHARFSGAVLHTRSTAFVPVRAASNLPRPGTSRPGRRPPPAPTKERKPAVTRVAASGRIRGGYLFGVSIFGAALGIYAVTFFLAERRSIKKNAELDIEQNADVSHRWNDESRNFDQEIDSEESVMLMRAKRRRLINEAYGKVLEVSVGTGRNMDLYDLRPFDPKEEKGYGRSRDRLITSITFNDQSEVMVRQATDNFLSTELKKPDDERFRGDVTFVIGDAHNEGVIDRPEGGFDTIVQTFGICSMTRPVEFLQTLGKLCRQPGEAAAPSKGDEEKADEGGQILLLEHGHGKYEWLNNYLDSKAKLHALHYGCWFNKDIDQVIKDSGLKVERVRQYHAGTTWEIVLRPVAANVGSSKAD